MENIVSFLNGEKRRTEENINKFNDKISQCHFKIEEIEKLKEEIIRNIEIPVFFFFLIIAMLAFETILEDIYYKNNKIYKPGKPIMNWQLIRIDRFTPYTQTRPNQSEKKTWNR